MAGKDPFRRCPDNALLRNVKVWGLNCIAPCLDGEQTFVDDIMHRINEKPSAMGIGDMEIYN